MFTFCIAVISNPHNTLNQLNKKKQRNNKAVADAKLLSGRHTGMQAIWICTPDLQCLCIKSKKRTCIISAWKKIPGCMNALMQMGMHTITFLFPTYKCMCSCFLSMHYLSLMNVNLTLCREGYSIHCSYKRRNIHIAATASLTDKSYKKKSYLARQSEIPPTDVHSVTHRALCNWLVIKM